MKLLNLVFIIDLLIMAKNVSTFVDFRYIIITYFFIIDNICNEKFCNFHYKIDIFRSLVGGQFSRRSIFWS